MNLLIGSTKKLRIETLQSALLLSCVSSSASRCRKRNTLHNLRAPRKIRIIYNASDESSINQIVVKA